MDRENMMSSNSKINKFIAHVQSETKKKNIKCVLAKRKYLILKDESYCRCNGYFDEENLVLKCAINKPIKEWVQILVHEFSHFEQWTEGCKAWTNCCEVEDGTIDIFEWIKGKEIDKKIIKKYYLALKNLELDCERRAVVNINKFKLPIDPVNYAKKANAYVLFYDYVFQYRKWYQVGKVPYENKEIVNAMPSRIVPNGKFATKKQLRLFDKLCL